MIEPTYAQLLFGYLLYSLTPYTNVILLLVLQYFSIRSYMITGDNEKYRSLVKQLEANTYNSSFVYRNQKCMKSGFFFGKECVGFCDREARFIEDEKITLYTTEKFFKQLTAEQEPKEIDMPTPTIVPSTKIKKYERSGSFRAFFYLSTQIDIGDMVPLGKQQTIVDDILRLYAKKSWTSVFIHGTTGTGKSSVGYLVAKALGGNYCNSFHPTDPGDNFTNMLSEIRNRDESTTPLIIVLEEANELIRDIHFKRIVRHKETPIPITNKMGWVKFADSIKFHRHVILILTSNESKENIDELDPAYLNSARFDAVYSMMDPLPLTEIAESEALS